MTRARPGPAADPASTGLGEPLPHPATGGAFPSPVPPGTGWPGDPARPDTPVATSAAEVEERATALAAAEAGGRVESLADLEAQVSVCRACPRLVQWREDVALAKRAAFAAEPYWGRPIAGWGDPRPGVLVVGLAPAAHGGNRTGRIFTGDRSGDWLFASLHRVGLAGQSTSVHADDGQRLLGARMAAAVRCAPPLNKPTPHERDTCAPWLDAELALVAEDLRVMVALGSFGWHAALRACRSAGWQVPRPRPKFGHGAEAVIGRPGAQDVLLLGCYHPSQQNTFTGKLTEEMLDDVLGRAARAATMPG